MDTIPAQSEMVAILSERLGKLTEGAIAAGPRIVLALALILVAWLVISGVLWLLRISLRRAGTRQNLVGVLTMVMRAALWLGVGLMALTIVFPSVTPAKALATLGLGSVAIGFAFKDTFENFLAGILILLREPFEIGDHIATDSVEGQIEEITVRDTRIRKTDGQLIVVPNSHLFSSPVTVRTSQQLRRTEVIVGIAYGEDVDAARKVIEDAVQKVDSVRDDIRDVQVFAKAFGASSVDFEVAWWTGSRPIDIRASRDQVVAAVKAALDAAGIEIPFPYQTLTFKEPLRIAATAG
ncbi:MAG: mechanosensitive ion channel family protein [Rhodobacteraceae bacterium]|nr:mechanosensitive ion channel family protein [Paracoccaceae bacterium]